MPDGDMYDLIIVGGGPAGLSAALYATKAAVRTLLIERGSIGGQVAITKGVENFPGIKSISGFDLSENFLKHAKSFGLEVLDEEVVSVQPGDRSHSLRLTDGRELHTHALILATGGIPRKLNIPGENKFFGKGVSYCAKCDGFFFLDQTIVVVGGGDSATEEALYLAKIASRIHLVHRGKEFRAQGILRQRLKGESKIETYVSSIITEIKGNDEGVYSVILKNLQTGERKELATEGVFIFIGLSPANRLVPEGVKMTADGYVVTNENRETNIPGIFVAGDLRMKYANQIVIAVADGCVAGLAASRYVDLIRERKLSCPIKREEQKVRRAEEQN